MDPKTPVSSKTNPTRLKEWLIISGTTPWFIRAVKETSNGQREGNGLAAARAAGGRPAHSTLSVPRFGTTLRYHAFGTTPRLRILIRSQSFFGRPPGILPTFWRNFRKDGFPPSPGMGDFEKQPPQNRTTGGRPLEDCWATACICTAASALLHRHCCNGTHCTQRLVDYLSGDGFFPTDGLPLPVVFERWVTAILTTWPNQALVIGFFCCSLERMRISSTRCCSMAREVVDQSAGLASR